MTFFADPPTHASKRALQALRDARYADMPFLIETACKAQPNGKQMRPLVYGLMTAEVQEWQIGKRTLPLPTCKKCLQLVLEALVELAGKRRGQAISAQEIDEAAAKMKENAT